MLKYSSTPTGYQAADVRFTGFLSRLNEADKASLRACLEPVEVDRGTVLLNHLDTSEYVYFSQGPLISIRYGNCVEVALIGSEGFVGWPALLGCSSSPFIAMICGREGNILRIEARQLRALAAARPTLSERLSSFVNMVGLQMAENIGAHASHRVDLRLARWILLRHDRVSGDEIIVQHDEIAAQLGTRRATVTDTLHILEGAGHVRGKRGRLIVRDRAGLERVAGSCYGASEGFYRSAIGAFGKSPTPAGMVQHRECGV